MHYRGLVYRALNPFWARQPLSGEGARKHGGRFNPKGTPALYTALDIMTAIREVGQIGQPLQPTTLISLRADVEPVFDATDHDAVRHFGFAPDDLSAPDWRVEMYAAGKSRSQSFAEHLIAEGYAALLTPSYARDAQPGDRNLVFWRWTEPGAMVRLNDREGRLSPDPG